MTIAVCIIIALIIAAILDLFAESNFIMTIFLFGLFSFSVMLLSLIL